MKDSKDKKSFCISNGKNCRLKEASIEELPLLKLIKKRIEKLNFDRNNKKLK